MSQPPYAPQPQHLPPPPKSGFGAWISKPIVMVGIMAFLGVAAMAGFVAFYFLSARDFTPNASQKACLITATDLATQFAMTVDPSAETWKAERYFDGAIEIDYEYDDTSPAMIYLNCTLSVDPNVSDANFSMAGYWTGFKMGTKLGGGGSIDIEMANHIFKWGDASKFAFLKSGSSRYGFVCLTRKGTKVYFVCAANAVLEDPAEVDAFLRPFLERFEREAF